MIEYNFEVCFICHYPTTDWSEMPDGEKHCGLCVAEAAEQYAEQVALFEAMEYDFTSEDLAEMYHDMAQVGVPQPLQTCYKIIYDTPPYDQVVSVVYDRLQL